MENRKLVRQYLEKLPRQLKAFVPCAPASDRAAWLAIEPSLRLAAVARAEMLCRNLRWENILASDFLDFSRTGNRIRFEKKYFSRRNMLNTLVVAECIEGCGRFLPHIIDGVYLVLGEATWALPAHNTYIRDAAPAALPDTSAPVLDLFALETGAQLAMTIYLLGDALDAVSPEIVNSVRKAIAERVMKPYLSAHFWWMGDGDEPMCNWTPWCSMNALLCSAILHYNELAVVKKAAHSLDCFLKDYGEDGCCNEGVQYYRAAGLCLIDCLRIMNAITSGAFSALYAEPKIRNIASFVCNMHVGGEYFINFGDCSAIAGRSGAREFIAGRLVGDESLSAFAAAQWAASPMSERLRERDITSTEGINLYYRVTSLFAAKEIADFRAEKANAQSDSVWYESVGVFVARNANCVLAVKAGGNGDSHNHNDTGSFTVFAHEKPLFIDLGVETYSAKTFSADRYSIWTMQSSYHNLPDINSRAQCAGGEFAAQDICVSADTIRFDIARAYPADANVEHYVREIRLLADGFSLADSFDAGADVYVNLMTQEKPILCAAKSLSFGSLARLEIESDIAAVEIEEIAITDERLLAAWKSPVYRTRIHATGGTFSGKCSIL